MHKTWIGIWRKLVEDVNIRFAGSNEETFLSVVFGNFYLTSDILNRSHKLDRILLL